MTQFFAKSSQWDVVCCALVACSKSHSSERAVSFKNVHLPESLYPLVIQLPLYTLWLRYIDTIIVTQSYGEEPGNEVTLTVECDKDSAANYMCAVMYPAPNQVLLCEIVSFPGSYQQRGESLGIRLILVRT